eukprot:scaffold6514_cov241-Prasinococcus_capsulatus_cf.AAC.2
MGATSPSSCMDGRRARPSRRPATVSPTTRWMARHPLFNVPVLAAAPRFVLTSIIAASSSSSSSSTHHDDASMMVRSEAPASGWTGAMRWRYDHDRDVAP